MKVKPTESELEDDIRRFHIERFGMKREMLPMQVAVTQRSDLDIPVSSIAAGRSYLPSLLKPPIGAVSGMSFAFPITW